MGVPRIARFRKENGSDVYLICNQQRLCLNNTSLPTVHARATNEFIKKTAIVKARTTRDGINIARGLRCIHLWANRKSCWSSVNFELIDGAVMTKKIEVSI
jgi:hypothetical protein